MTNSNSAILARTNIPTWEEVSRFIEQHAYHRAVQSIGHQPFIECEPGRESPHTIRCGSRNYRRAQDGTMENETTNPSGSILDEKIRSDRFRNHWQTMTDEPERIIRQEIRNLLGLHTEDGNQDNETRELHRLLSERRTETKISRTAKSVRNATVGSQIMDPDAVGRAQLWAMMGRENVGFALKVAGSQATWGDFNSTIQNRDEIERAHQANPNATVLWFQITRDRYYQQFLGETEGRDPRATADSILEAVKTTFLKNVGNFLGCNNGEGKIFCLDRVTKSPEEIWEAFCKLSPRAVRAFPPVDTDHLAISTIAAQAETNPSYSAIAGFMQHPHRNQLVMPWYFIQAAFRESRKRLDKPRKGRTQGDIRAKIKAAYQFMMTMVRERHYREVDHHPAWQELAETNPDADWEAWMEAAPGEVRNASGPGARSRKAGTPTRGRGSAQEKPARRPTREAWNNQVNEMLYALGGPDRAKNEDTLWNALTLRASPGKEVIMEIRGQSKPLFRAVRSERGTITVTGSEHFWAGRVVLHANGTTNLSTGGMGATIARAKVREILERKDMLPKGMKPQAQQNVIGAVTDRFLRDAPPYVGESLNDSVLTARLSRMLRQLVDSEYLERTYQVTSRVTLDELGEKSYSKPVTLELYNLVRSAEGMLDELQESNPGAIQWLMGTNDLEGMEEVKHPGQIISQARKSMEKHGLSRQAWKTATTMNGETMRELATRLQPGMGAMLLNAAQQARAEDADDLAKHLLRYSHRWSRSNQDNGNDQGDQELSGLTQENIQRMLDLAARDKNQALVKKGKTQRYDEDLLHTTDYVRAMSAAGQRIASTTWGGLSKAQERWHRKLKETQMARRWQEMMGRSSGEYQCWNSLVEGHRTGELTTQSLNSEYDLYRESEAMEHCVIGYGTQCSRGRSRVFRIMDGDQHIGTGEIALENGQWVPVQTRGKHNHRLGREAEEAMEQTATAYNQEWSKPRGQRAGHRSWSIHQTENPELMQELAELQAA